MSFFPFKNNTHDLWTCFQYLKEVHVHIDTGWAGHNIPVYVSIACQVLTRASHDWCRHHSWTLPDAEVRDTQNWGQLGGATWKEVEDQHSLLTDEMLHLSLWVSYGISTIQPTKSLSKLRLWSWSCAGIGLIYADFNNNKLVSITYITLSKPWRLRLGKLGITRLHSTVYS